MTEGTQIDFPASPDHMNLEVGRDTISRVRQSIASFQTEVLPTLHVGPQTEAACKARCDDLLSRPDSTVLENSVGAYYYKPADAPPELGFSLGGGVESLEKIARGAQAVGIMDKIDPADARQLATDLVIYHELTHALVDEAGLSAVDEVGTHPPFPNAEHPIRQLANREEHKEGLAEGLAQMAVTKRVAEKYDLASDVATTFGSMLTSEIYEVARAKLVGLLDELPDIPHDPAGDEEWVLARLRTMGCNVSIGLPRILAAFGYGNPMPADEVLRITSAMP